MSVRLSACVNLCISQETHVEISRFLYMLPVAVARHCNTLCTSGFADDVMFLCNGANGTESDYVMFSRDRHVAAPGRSYCLRLKACTNGEIEALSKRSLG